MIASYYDWVFLKQIPSGSSGQHFLQPSGGPVQTFNTLDRADPKMPTHALAKILENLKFGVTLRH